MGNIKKYIVHAILFLGVAGFCQGAFALPTFQAYIQGGVAGDVAFDKDSWMTAYSPFNIFIVGAYGPNTESIKKVTLLVSVPEGEKGTISFTTPQGDEAPILLNTAGSGDFANPTRNADIDILTDIPATKDGYSIKNFFPTGFMVNEHDPIKDNMSDFILFDLGNFDDEDSVLYNYNADSGIIETISRSDPWGEQKVYTVTYSGFSRIHFDGYGLIEDKQGSKTVYNWEINPGSHDATSYGGGDNVIPEPGSMALLGIGLLGLGRRFRRK